MTEQFPDMTLDEIAESDDEMYTDVEGVQEAVEDYEDFYDGAVLYMMAAGFMKMLTRNQITVKEYVELIDNIEEIAEDEGVELP